MTSASVENQKLSAEERYQSVVRASLEYARISFPEKSRKSFGSSALWINYKMLALLSSKGEFVVKLSRERVDELVVASKFGQKLVVEREPIGANWTPIRGVECDSHGSPSEITKRDIPVGNSLQRKIWVPLIPYPKLNLDNWNSKTYELSLILTPFLVLSSLNCEGWKSFL